MWDGQTFRAFVNERLAVEAGEIRAQFERTTAECEEQLRLCEEENQRKQRLLDKIVSPRVVLVRARVPTKPSTRPGRNQDVRQTPRIKEEPEEQRIKQEEELLPVCFPETSAVSVKREEPSLLRQRQNERGNISSAQNKSAPETSMTVNDGETSGADGGEERKKHQCHVCDKRCRGKYDLTQHTRVHTGEKPFKCSTCQKTFNQMSNLNKHRRTHTGERPHGCLICNKTFTLKSTLDVHRRTHTGARPYSCQVCEKRFTELSTLQAHRRTHTGERPYSCQVCEKRFTELSTLQAHRRTHTGERPYSCQVCEKRFTELSTLQAHRRTHTGERPYCCSVCQKTFTQGGHLKRHMNTHSV